MKSMKNPLWSPTKFANLIRYAPSGVYFARAKVNGHLIRKSLGTRSVEVAKTKLDELLNQERARRLSFSVGEVEKLTFHDCCNIYREHVASHPDSKPRTKAALLSHVLSVEQNLPKWAKRKVGAISRQDCIDAVKAVRKQYSASYFNSWLIALRAVLAVGVNAGAMLTNPATPRHKNDLDVDLTFARVRLKELTLPTTGEFLAILENMQGQYRRRRAAVTIQFLAFSGMRISEAVQMTPANVNIERGEFTLPASICKSGKERRVPIIPEMRTLLVKLLSEYPGKGSLMPVKNPKLALTAVCKDLGIQRLTNHDLRHYFATRCLESGVDVKTVASWLGHEDGGSLLLKRYAHLRNEHSQAMAATVSFGTLVSKGGQ